MTTTVVVHPAGHHVRIMQTDKNEKAETIAVTAIDLAPGTQPKTLYVTNHRSLEIFETGLQVEDGTSNPAA